MRNKLVKGLLATSLIGGMAVGMAPFASADSLDTETIVGFKSDSHIEPPVDPVDGTLALLWAPKKFDFGQQHVAGASGPAISESLAEDAYVVVRDDRPTAASGEWKVTVVGSKLKSGTKDLGTAQYTLTKGSAIKYLGSSSPELAASKGAPDNTITTFTETFAADGADEQVIATAVTSAKDAWSIKAGDIALDVAASDVAAAAGGEKYTGTLTWTLSDTI